MFQLTVRGGRLHEEMRNNFEIFYLRQAEFFKFNPANFPCRQSRRVRISTLRQRPRIMAGRRQHRSLRRTEAENRFARTVTAKAIRLSEVAR